MNRTPLQQTKDEIDAFFARHSDISDKNLAELGNILHKETAIAIIESFTKDADETAQIEL